MFKKGKRFGAPPMKGPQPQGMNSGRLVEPKLKQRPVKKIQTLPLGRTENNTSSE